MKRTVSIILVFALISAIFPTYCLAVESDSETIRTVYFDDGSYMTEQYFIVNTRASGTITGNKINTYYANDGTASWKAVLSGTFSYTGSSATCTASNCNVTIYHTSWYTISKTTGKSGNTATANVTMGYKTLGVTTNQVSTNISLTCDKNGNLS